MESLLVGIGFSHPQVPSRFEDRPPLLGRHTADSRPLGERHDRPLAVPSFQLATSHHSRHHLVVIAWAAIFLTWPVNNVLHARRTIRDKSVAAFQGSDRPDDAEELLTGTSPLSLSPGNARMESTRHPPRRVLRDSTEAARAS